MENNEIFKRVLDSDETICKVYKPNKFRFCVLQTIITEVSLLIFLLVFGFAFFMSRSDGEGSSLFLLIPLVIIILIMIVTVVGAGVRYKNTKYVITTKRIIISHGFIGVDFTTLDLNSITTVDVNVGLLDKMTKPETGTITFGSSSMPVVNNGRGTPSMFAFANVEKPYDVYREVKEFVDEAKK